MDIKVTHLGEDYATIELNQQEFETSLAFGLALHEAIQNDIPRKKPNTVIYVEDGLNYYAAYDLNLFYRVNNDMLEYQEMWVNPLSPPNDDAWCVADEELVGDEIVTFEDAQITFEEVYRTIRKKLTK